MKNVMSLIITRNGMLGARHVAVPIIAVLYKDIGFKVARNIRTIKIPIVRAL